MSSSIESQCDKAGKNDTCRKNYGSEVVEMVRPRGTDKAKVIQVIETESIRGNGTDTDPVRLIKQYWDFEGNLLAENDAREKEKE